MTCPCTSTNSSSYGMNSMAWVLPFPMMTGYGFKDKTNTKPQPNKYEGVPESSHLTSRGRAKTWYGAENVVRSRLRSVRRGYETFARLRKGFDDTERSSE